jgi:4-amino-4-deoxy-L-arabinose transferase-like glycosyltransferase
MHLKDKQKQNLISYLLLAVAVYFVVFAKLGEFPFRFWDESMFAVNAYEMDKNGNYMVPYFNNEIDWRNSKPLLLTWIQVGFIKIFGFNELAIRLPGASAVALSVFMLFMYLNKRVNQIFAWITSLILLTSVGYIGFHTGRTGDADAVLSFFLLGFALLFIEWTLDNKPRDLVIAFLFFGLAILTKSFAAFLFLPGAIVFAVYIRRRSSFQLIRQVSFYIAILLVATSLFLAFGLREIYQSGYLNYTLHNDAYRLGTVIETHRHSWDFYLENIFYNRFAFWTVPFIIGIFLIRKVRSSFQAQSAVGALLIVFFYLIIISGSVTKLVWYDMPIFPLMATIAGIPVYMVIQIIAEEKSKLALIMVLAGIFILPYRKMFFAAQSNSMDHGDRVTEMTSLYLHHKTKQNLEDNITVFHYGYAGSLLCYTYMYADRGKELKVNYEPLFSVGEKVFVSNENLKQSLSMIYETDTLETFETGLLVKIISHK